MCADTISKSKTSRRRRVSKGTRRPSKRELIIQQRGIPCYQLLDSSDLTTLEHHADWLLETVGIEFTEDPVALELFAETGAKINGTRVRFEAGLARSLCSSAPSEFQLHARDPRHTVTLGGDNVVLMPGYGSPFVTDLDKGRRYATLHDFENFVKLTYLLPALHHSGGTVVEPTDVPVNKRHLDMVAAHLRLSTKPFMGAVTTAQRAQDSIDMAQLVFGAKFMQEHAVMQANININSPFIFDGSMSAALRTYASANQCVCISPAIFGGAMGPVTPAAMSAQTLAEAMAGIALVQLVRPGCPTVFGSFHSTMNLRSGSLTFGTPEANLVTLALTQLGKRLGVPVRSGGGQITAANSADGQAMMDSTNAMWPTMLAGSHQVWHAAGWLEGGLTMSYEKFLLDVDNCGALLRMFLGMAVDEEALSRESYVETGPGDNFLSTSHTMRHYATANYESLLPDTGPYETWADNGSPSAEQRANAAYKTLLNQYKKPALASSVDTELGRFVLEKKTSLPDEWY